MGAIYLIFAAPTLRSILIGAAFALAGLLIRGAAAGYLQKDKVLAVTGPYAYTRNPLYLGSALLACGFMVAGYSYVAGAAIGLYFAVFYYAVMRNEEEDLRVRFGPPFERYARLVPLFFPRAVNPADLADLRDPNAAGFRWAQFVRNREYQAVLGTIAGLGVLYLRMWIRGRYGY